MKKLLLTAGICMTSLFFVQAQTTAPASAAAAAPLTAQQYSEKMMTAITATCHLTSDQAAKVKPVITEFVNSMLANKQKFGTDKDKLKAANQATKKERDTKLNGILSAEQQKQFAAKEAEMKANMKQAPAATDNK
jgi:hypothetical protein